MVKKLLIAVPLLIVVYAAVAFYQVIQKAKSEDPLVWEEDIEALETQLKEHPSRDGAVLFIGSSSIRLWESLAEDMYPLEVVQRGFGGAKLGDVVHYADRLLDIGVTPGAIVVFVGTNDIHPGAVKEPAVLLQKYKNFLAVVRSHYADVPVYYIAITPSIMRWEVWDVAQQTNRLIMDYWL